MYTTYTPIPPLLYSLLGGWESKIVYVIEKASNFTYNIKIHEIKFLFFEKKSIHPVLTPFPPLTYLFLKFLKGYGHENCPNIIKSIEFYLQNHIFQKIIS